MPTFSEIIGLLLTLLILAGGLYGVTSLLCVLRFFRPTKAVSREIAYPPVSILKPVRGKDPHFRGNLMSFLTQEYPEYEMLLGFASEQDEGLPVAKEVESSSQRTRVVINEEPSGANPKVSNLRGLVDAARYPLLLISDSDIRVAPDYLKTIVAEYLSDRNAGSVTCLKKIVDAESMGAAFESLALATDLVPSILVARFLEGMTFALGPSILLSKDALEGVGGLSALADYLAEDYQIGYRLWQKGRRTILSRHVIENVVGKMSLAGHVLHQLRWARTYRACRPKGFFGFGITHILPFSLLLLIVQGLGTLSLFLFAGTLALRVSLFLLLFRKGMCPRGRLRLILFLPLKDILSFAIWVWSLCGSRVFWRGRYYRIIRGGLLEKADS